MQNQSGWMPIEYNVMLKQVETQETTNGGVFLPGETQDRNMYGETQGTIVELSPMAFEYEDWPSDIEKPCVGQEILFVKHAGLFVDGEDGEKYRVIKDKDVVAVKL
ncbi:MAG: co-chaperone GroES [Pseudomonadota bacterium]